ncbi:hypothetical protein GmHk_01G000437 [Glycine max]|nr:hypothetical protein GmHk_01G000437 [Glycine max]
MHSVTYNQDLVNPTILVEWIEFKDFYGLTRNHQVTMTHFGQTMNQKLILNDTPYTIKFLTQSLLKSCQMNTKRLAVDVLNIMYSFMKVAGFTHLYLEEITECMIVYNHWRKFAKIDYGWKTFAQLENLQA